MKSLYRHLALSAAVVSAALGAESVSAQALAPAATPPVPEPAPVGAVIAADPAAPVTPGGLPGGPGGANSAYISGGGFGGGGGGVGMAPPGGETVTVFGNQAFTYSPNRAMAKPAAPKLVVFGNSNSTNQETLSEDLRIMSFLLEKNLSRTFVNSPTIKMGIRLEFAETSQPIRSLYLEGYGAVFFINVNFPLAGTAGNHEQPEKTPKNTEWDEARRNLNGNQNDSEAQWAPQSNPYPAGPAFNPDQVENMKDELIRSLKNAANVRGLSADDLVVISVEGAAMPVVVWDAGSDPRAGANSNFRGYALSGRFDSYNAGKTGTAIAIRAKKSDIDAYASKQLKFEDFKKKVVVTTRVGTNRIEGGEEQPARF